MSTSLHRHVRVLRGLLSIASVVVIAPLVHAQIYAAVGLGSLGGSIYPTAINNAGTIVGQATLANGQHDAFSYSNGQMTDLASNASATAINNSGTILIQSGAQGYIYSSGTTTSLGLNYATGIDDGGTVVGYDVGPFGAPTAVSYSGGTVQAFNPWIGGIVGNMSTASAINSSGVIVGWDEWRGNAYSYRHAYTYLNGATQDLGSLVSGVGNSYANAINNSGTMVVGSSDTNSGDSHAFVFTSGAMQDIGTLGGLNSAAYGVNSSGLVVGYALTAGGAQDAFVYSNGTMTDLNSLVNIPGVTLTYAAAVNDAGEIVAEGSDNHAYLLTLNSSVPEPTTYAAMAGVVVLGFATLRRRRQRAG